MAKTRQTDESLQTRLDDFPEVLEAARQVDDMYRRVLEVQGRVGALETRLGELESGEVSLELAARVLAGEASLAVIEDTTPLVAELEAAKRELRLLETAEQLAIDRLYSARAKAKAELIPRVKARYGELCNQIVGAVCQLRMLLAEEVEFRDQFNGSRDNSIQVIPTPIQPMVIPLDDERMARIFTDAHEAGLIDSERLQRFLELCPHVATLYR